MSVKLEPPKPGIVRFRLAKPTGCGVARVGVVGVFKPVVTG